MYTRKTKETVNNNRITRIKRKEDEKKKEREIYKNVEEMKKEEEIENTKR